jgi:hypothetical protein
MVVSFHPEPRKPRGIFRGSELPRLMSMLFMLVLLALMIARASDPGTWAWLAGDADRAAAADQPAASEAKNASSKSPNGSKAPPEIVFAGPTDEDEEELDAIAEEFTAVSDGRMSTEIEDVIGAYRRLTQWTLNQSFAAMSRRARSGVTLDELIKNPEQFRGKLLKLELNVARVRKYTDKDVENLLKDQAKGVELYEIWGTTGDSTGRLCEAVVAGLPPGMPVGMRVEQKATLTGYFYKLQGYESGEGKRKLAPWLIGRLSLSPLPLGEVQGEGTKNSPLPLGEGQGDGIKKSPLPSDLQSVTGEGQGEGEYPFPKDNPPPASAAADFARVTDGTSTAEAPAYRRLLEWTLDQSFSDLQQQARADVAFTDLYLYPAQYRGDLVQVRLNVKMITPIPDAEARKLLGNKFPDARLYEVKGNSPESKSRFYMAAVAGLPEGMPIGSNLDEEAVLAGYFFKLMSYKADRDGRTWEAPLLVGRLEWRPRPQPSNAELYIGLLAVGVVAVLLAVGWGVFLLKHTRQKAASVSLKSSVDDSPADPALANWLQRAQTGRGPSGFSRNVPDLADRNATDNLDDLPHKEG